MASNDKGEPEKTIQVKVQPRTRYESLQIVCVTTAEPHRHVVRVGIGGSANDPSAIMTVREVRDALDEGAFFCIVSPSTDNVALVEKGTCEVPNCQVETICSNPDAVADNILNSLTTCP